MTHKKVTFSLSSLTRSLFFCVCLFSAAHCFAANLRFAYDGPAQLRPGDTFTIDLVAEFTEDPGTPRPEMKLSVLWPYSMYVADVEWNTQHFDYSTREWSQSGNRAYFYTETQPLQGRWNPTGTYVVATLVCYANESDEDPIFYDTYSDDYTTEITVNGLDILGDPADPNDGVDEYDIDVMELYGYHMTSEPAESSVPFIQKEIPVNVVLNYDESSSVAPHVYDHIRITMDFDTFALSNVTQTLLPSFFTNVYEGYFVTNAIVDGVERTFQIPYVEGECVPTNYTGVIAQFTFLPRDIDSELECDIESGLMDFITQVDCHGAIDLLGLPDDYTDALFNGLLDIRNVDGMHIRLEPHTETPIVHSNFVSDLVISFPYTNAVLLDTVELTLAVNQALFSCSNTCFTLNPAFTSTPVDVECDLSESLYPHMPIVSNSYSYTETNAYITLYIEWDDENMLFQNGDVLGTLSLTPLRTGTAGILCDYAALEYFFSTVGDDDAQQAVWPLTFPVISPEDSVHLSVSLTRSDAEEISPPPGAVIAYDVLAAGRPVADGSYSLAWIYDPTLLEPVTLPNIDYSTEILKDGSTASVVRVEGNNYSASDGTQILHRIVFTATHSGISKLTPLTIDDSDNYCRFVQNNQDILGVASIADDGVKGITTVIRCPEGLTCTVGPDAPMIAGATSPITFRIENPRRDYFNTVRLCLQFYSDEIITEDTEWHLAPALADTANIAFNTIVHDVPVASGYIDDNGVEITNFVTEARLGLVLDAPISTGLTVATLNVTALDEDPYYGFMETSNVFQRTTAITYNDVPVLDTFNLDETEWSVVPNAISIWLDDGNVPVILGNTFSITARVSNPYGIPIDRFTLCYEFDSLNMEIDEFTLLNGLTTEGDGLLRINNSNDGDGYICADIYCTTPVTTDCSLVTFTVMPKLNDILYLEPSESDYYFEDVPNFAMGAYTENGIYLLETMFQFPEDVCPIWTRGVTWRDVPQLSFDDVYLEPNEQIELDLLFDGEGLSNGSEDKLYTWWTEGNSHITVEFYDDIKIAMIIPDPGWIGEETFKIYCREVTPEGEAASPIGWASIHVVVEKWLLEIPRDEFITVTRHTFNDAVFFVEGAPTTAVVSASFSKYGTDEWEPALIEDVATHTRGTAVPVQGKGRVIWNTPSTPGEYIGKITLSNTWYGDIDAQLYVTVLHPNMDEDGDRFIVLFNRKQLQLEDRSIRINRGSNTDKLEVKVYQGDQGDGVVRFDTITSDAGFKKLKIPASAHRIITKGPIGTLQIEGGWVDVISVGSGGLKNLTVNNKWLKNDEEFLYGDEVGVGSIHVTGTIHSIKVKGGILGNEYEDEFAEITAINGSIDKIKVSAITKTVGAGGDAWSYIEGGHIWASIRATYSIGQVITKGGDIGNPFTRDFGDPSRTIKAGKDIKKIAAIVTRDKDMQELWGGSLRASVKAGGTIKKILSIGGGIFGDEIDIDEVPDQADLPYGRINVTAKSVGSIMSKARVMLFKDGPNPVWDWFRACRGGTLAVNLNVEEGVKKIIAQGGDASLFAYAPNYIDKITTKRIYYKMFLDDDTAEHFGGDLVASRICASEDAYKSENQREYTTEIKSMKVDGMVRDSWIGIRGPIIPSKLKYVRLIQSEIWIARYDLGFLTKYTQ